ncbi:MAG TPA: hypothetical protein VD947_00835 [Patescibacteria group bacterium]|nr:hypothetical protein [Patescibacteria group bacterium]
MLTNKSKIFSHQSVAFFILLSFFSGMIISFIPIRSVQAQTFDNLEDALNSYCNETKFNIPVQTGDAGLQYPDPKEVESKVAACQSGFYNALAKGAVRPANVNGTNTPCYKIQYPRNTSLAYACAHYGYIPAFKNRNHLINLSKNKPKPSQELQDQRKALAECDDKVGASGTNKDQLMEWCAKGYIGAKNGKKYSEVCKGTTSVNISYCRHGYNLANGKYKGAGDPGPSDPDADAAGDAAGDEDANCSGEGLSIGWVICPIVETASNFGKYTFENIIQPLMEESPLSTDPADPTYKSWQAFRLIGNILLIASMLAIVYSQAKGGE